MKYKELKGVNDTKFMRLIGVKRELFEFQAAILEDALKEKHGDSGRPYKLTVEDTSPPIDVWLFKRLYTIQN